MPSVTEVRPFSAAFARSHSAFTSSAVSARSSPNTCGWRWISFATMPPATSSMSNGSSVSSAAILAWKTTWSSTSPSSSRSSARSPASMASISSYISSTPYGARSSLVCVDAQGHTARMRSITCTRSSSRAPGRS